MANALFPWLLAIAILFFYIQYTLIVSHEEEYLAQTFGEAFAHYAQHVQRFLPRLTPYKSLTPHPKQVNLHEGLSSEKRTLQAIGLVTAVIVAIYVIRL